MISLTDICFSYPNIDKPVFSGLNLRVDTGSWVAVTGPDSSGKSTLAKLLKGLVKPTSGTITSDVPFPDGIAWLGGDPYDMLVGISVEDDVAFGMENLGMPRQEMEVRLDQALRWTGLQKLRYRLTHTLSGGEQQKLALAGVLAMGVRILVLDEALSMLDRPARKSIHDLIQELRREPGLTVVEMTTQLEELFDADRTLFLDKGNILFDGPPLDFIHNPVGKQWCTTMGGVGGLAAALVISGVLPDLPGSVEDLTSTLIDTILK